MNRTIGDLALEIRGTIGAINIYLKLEKYEFLMEQIIRATRLESELTNYKQVLNNNIVHYEWHCIAKEEIKDLIILKKEAIQSIKLKLIK